MIQEQLELFHKAEEELSEKEKQKLVMIEGAINLKLMCDYVVKCGRGDLILIICMIHEYIKMLDETRDTIQWQCYYRDRFIRMADHFADQIGYDYDKAMERCRKNLSKKESDSDIGGDALELAAKK